MRKIISVLVVFMMPLAISFADDQQEPQEAIEYKSIEVKKVTCDIGVLYVKRDQGLDITVAAVATGKGAEFRKWEPTDIKLDIDGVIIRSNTSDKFYGTKESIFRLPAAFVFAAIGTQYERHAFHIEKSGGTYSISRVEVGGVAGAIDKAGMAAGMGLLVSQAKGEITGLRNTFKVDKELADKIEAKKAKVKIVIENKEAQKKERIKVPLLAVFEERGEPAKGNLPSSFRE